MVVKEEEVRNSDNGGGWVEVVVERGWSEFKTVQDIFSFSVNLIRLPVS